MNAQSLIGYLLTVALLTGCADLSSRVVRVSDGDTVTTTKDGAEVKVRLAEIDAPEKAQAYGAESTESLIELCLNKDATLEEQGKDRYGRTLARLHCNGKDANAEQVRRGMAWVYRRYTAKDSPLYAVEDEAKAGKVGLWRDADPMPPWVWRHRDNAKDSQ
jgi:endonuclease YncB( thermonuclease family)